MLNVTIICLGKLKEKYLKDACSEYEKRLSTLCKLNLVELSPENLSENPSQKEIENALAVEAKKIKAKIPSNSFVFSMCIEGRQVSSVELSKKFEQIAIAGKSNIVFVIGSSFGLSDEIKSLSDYKLSMSKMTFPHQLARVMLLERIYRAKRIENGSKYHK